ncbi:MAG: SulP family inorganic anion transporter, partial [Nitrospira sp.]|nr:SulP family inorganic anion transporter [Nitrospira sp.]
MVETIRSLVKDFTAGLVVFLVAVPLCLGIALASGAPLISGLLTGIVGGIVVGTLSGSHTSVSGPAAGLTAIVIAQLEAVGSFEGFLLAVFIAGLIQIAMGLLRAGFIAAFFPTSVIKGLLAAIGVILILKQIPHVLGHHTDPEGEMSFVQPDERTTFTELLDVIDDFHPGPAAIGLASIVFLVLWDRSKRLKKFPVPAPLLVVVAGVAVKIILDRIGSRWDVDPSHLVNVPVANSLSDFAKQSLQWPDFAQWTKPEIYFAAVTVALVASLESLLNIEAVDKLDPQQRVTPPNQELVAQGVGNVLCGLIGGLPLTSVIVRSSVNINAGAQSKLSAIFHGVLLLVCVVLLPEYLNMIPLSSLAAILLVTGVKLASPALVRQMWKGGTYQFWPFAITVLAIVFTDLLKGVIIGWLISIGFILYANYRRPLQRVVEKHLGGEVLHIVLANQVSFLSRGALLTALDAVPRGGHVLLDAQATNYIDPDVLDLIRDFKEVVAPARGIEVSLIGFQSKYQLEDTIQYVDYSTRELRETLTPQQVLQILKDGNERFRTGRRLTRDLSRQVSATAVGQHPFAVVVSCIDSRIPTELIFDVGVGDIKSIRISGNVISRKVLGSLEFACALAGAKLIVVLGHSQCSAVTTAVLAACSAEPIAQLTGCQYVEYILQEIQEVLDPNVCRRLDQLSQGDRLAYFDTVARANVRNTVKKILEQSDSLTRLINSGRLA